MYFTLKICKEQLADLHYVWEQWNQAQQASENREKINHCWNNYERTKQAIISRTGISNNKLTDVYNLHSQVQELESRKGQLFEAQVVVPPHGFLMLP